MGSNYCVQYYHKNKEDPNNKIKKEEKNFSINQLSSSNISFAQHNYNNFTKKFNSKLHYLGKYFDISEFNQKIPKKAYNYMIQNVLNIPPNIIQSNPVYEMKPVEFENGNIYSGNWNEKFKMEGYGQYYIKEVNLFVEGIWTDGKLIFGRIFFPNENIYEGEIKNSAFNGKGKLIFNNGDMYDGCFFEGERNGKGKYIFNDGTIYEGDFSNSEFKGHGVIKWKNGVEYEGDFNGLVLKGKGKLEDKINLEKYEGNFDNNYFNGFGKYYFNNYASYEGEFEFGIKNGKGNYKNKEGIFYEGTWANNLPNGIGKFGCNDFIVKGVWKNGINLEITDFIKGSVHNFDKNKLNFFVPNFNLCPQILNNLIFSEISDIKKSEGDMISSLF